ncbi:MAG: MFS transporter [Devosia sp.]|uniref:MFS transporter n=1 Tax=Devosia sp. TaxID=1871048 RepID=UPI0033943FB7
MARERLNWRLLGPLLLSATLLQVTVPLARIVTSYRAVEMAMPLSQLGILSSAFALLPVFLLVQIGQRNDRHGEGGTALAGVVLVALAILGLWLVASDFITIFAFTAMLGIGQVMVISALQLMTTRCSGPEGHDRVLGHFLVATSLGHVLGPLALSLTTPAGDLHPDQRIHWLLAAMAMALVLSGLAMVRALPKHSGDTKTLPSGIGSLLRTPGLLVILLSSSLCLTANDLIIVFFPVLGAAQGIDAATVGVLLSLRAIASMASRFMFSSLVLRVGKPGLISISLASTGLATAAFAFEMPLWLLGTVLAGTGFGMGLAIACSISLTLAIAPIESRATAMSLRLTASRLGQFLLPLGAGTVAAALGPGSIFAVVGAGLMVCGLLVRVSTPRA